MPNRLIKDSIHESEKVNALTDFQFRIWVNLITYVDDYGRGDARPAIIKGKCFPLRDRIANKDIEAALHALADTGCVGLYEVDGKPYLYFPNWESHQRVRKKISKYPAPPVDSSARQVAANGGHSRQIAANGGEVRPESNPNPESESESEDVGAEPPDSGRSTPASDPQPTPSGFDIPLNDGSFYNVPTENIVVYKRLYPAVDVEQALRNMIGWCMGNPTRRKTRRGVKRFITGWLAGDQDEGKTRKPSNQQKQYADEDDFY